MINCAKIGKNLVLGDCGRSTAAIEPEMVLVNFDDWKAATKEIDGNVLSSLVLASGANGYKYESLKNSFEKDCTLAKGTYQNGFDHKVVARVFANTQDIKDEVIKLSAAKVVAILKNSDSKTGAIVYEVYGADNGLEMSELTSPSTDTDGIHYSFTLASGDNAKESSLPLTLNAGSEDETKAMVDALCKAE